MRTWDAIRKPAPQHDPVREKAKNRLCMLDTSELLNWSEQAINGLHQSLDALRKGPDGAALQEARQAVSLLAGAVDVLEKWYGTLED